MVMIAWLSYLFLLNLFASGDNSATFTLTNNCDYPVWPGVLSNAATASFSTTGFLLDKRKSTSLSAPGQWSGRFWGRTDCKEDASGKFSCATGDCNSGVIECNGNGAKPPATLAEFTLDGSGGLDFYDVSLVDGYNLRMEIVPQGGSGNCNITGCVIDLNARCPSELRVQSTDGLENLACRSACEAFGDPQYCCSGEYASPTTCKPSSYSQFFKHACPRAYSYAYDDGSSTYTCASADYTIIFCPDYSSKKSTEESGANQGAAQLPLVNASMLDGYDLSSHGVQLKPACWRFLIVFAAVLAAVLLSSRH